MTPLPIFRILTTCAVLMSVGTPVSAQEAQYTLSGRVIDRTTQQPIATALIRIASLNRLAISDSLGRFALDKLYEGTYAIEVTRIGYETAEGSYRVARNDTMSALLMPLPIDIPALNAIVSRLQGRRERMGTFGQVYSAATLAAANGNILNFFQFRSHLHVSPCPDARGRRSIGLCAYRFGRDVPISLCVDERLLPSDFMDMFYPDEFEAAEIAGSSIRLYTRGYLERLARQKRQPSRDCN